MKFTHRIVFFFSSSFFPGTSKENIQKIQQSSKESKRREEREDAARAAATVEIPKLTWEQEKDLLRMMDMGMIPPPGAKEMMVQVLGRKGMEVRLERASVSSFFSLPLRFGLES